MPKEFDPDAFVATLAGKAPKQIDDVFNKMSANKRQTVAEALEPLITQDLRTMGSDAAYRNQLADQIERFERDVMGMQEMAIEDPEKAVMDPYDLEMFEGLKRYARVVFNVTATRSDKADPTLKIFAEEAERLSDKVFNSYHGQLSLLLNAAERVAVEVPATINPFRNKPGA